MMAQSAILISCSKGWAYDHCKAIGEAVAGSGYQYPVSFFDIRKPHLCSPSNGVLQTNTVENAILNSKKRKRLRSTTHPHSVIKLECGVSLEVAAFEVIELVKNSTSHGVKWVCEASMPTKSNTSFKATDDPIDFVELSNLAKNFDTSDNFEEIIHLSVGDNMDTCVVSKVVKNLHELCIIISALGAKFLIPPNSAFLMSDIEDIGKIVNLDQKYDFIVIDPPWSNKSVKRAKKYKSLSFNIIKSLPIKTIALSGCIIAVWVTNKTKVIDFVLQELFPAWSLKLIGKWYWVKVTTNGEFVYDFHSTHKKPYECLLIGRIIDNPDKLQSSQTTHEFPFNKIICSVPCRQHSRKPMLQEFMGEFLTENPNCLELFARNLVPGWTSWGNEVLKYQNTCYFETCDEC